MRIRTALPSDIPTIVAWRRQTAAWLATRGSDQWSAAGLPDDEFLSRVSTSVDVGETWMADIDDAAVGTAAIDQWSDTQLWTRDELRQSMIIHRKLAAAESVRIQFDGHRWRYVSMWGIDHADTIVEWPLGLILDPERAYVLRDIDGDAVIAPESATVMT